MQIVVPIRSPIIIRVESRRCVGDFSGDAAWLVLVERFAMVAFVGWEVDGKVERSIGLEMELQPNQNAWNNASGFNRYS
jgi:hypothetical protein